MTSGDSDREDNVLLDRITRQFSRYRLSDVLLGLHDALTRWRAGTLRTAIGPLQRAGRGHPMFDWAAAETVRFALLHCMRPPSDSSLVTPTAFQGWQSLEPLLHMACDAHLAAQAGSGDEWERELHSQPIHNAISPIWLSQFIVQRRSEFRVGQAIMLYRDAARRRAARDASFSLAGYEAALRRALGADLEPFIAALLQTYGRSVNHATLSMSILTPSTASRYDDIVLERKGGGVLVPHAYTALLNTLAGTPEQMVSWSAEQFGAPVSSPVSVEVVHAPNALTRFPIVRCFPDKPNYCIAPVPNLLLEWLYESLVDRVFEQCDSVFGRVQLSALFEEYVGLLAQRCCPSSARWVPETELKAGMPQGRNVIDWALLAGDFVVLVDAKRCYVRPAARYRWRSSDWSMTQKEIGKGVSQACDFWDAAQVGLVPRVAGWERKPAIALVVTQGDAGFHASRADWRASIDQSLSGPLKLPWAVVSLDDYDRLMSAWTTRDEQWLYETLLLIANGGSVRDATEGQLDTDASPLFRAFVRFLEEMQGALVERAEA